MLCRADQGQGGLCLRSSCGLQNVKGLYGLLRSQAFDLYKGYTRLLPHRFEPRQINVEITPEPQEADPPEAAAAGPKARSARRSPCDLCVCLMRPMGREWDLDW